MTGIAVRCDGATLRQRRRDAASDTVNSSLSAIPDDDFADAVGRIGLVLWVWSGLETKIKIDIYLGYLRYILVQHPISNTRFMFSLFSPTTVSGTSPHLAFSPIW
ncbi:hypothetical protein HRR85_003196 [Exophiala dermatitidis]|nr:hypothetical protein HRR79_003848 [Exophiala dermatitidis]KAJ4616343.1 hypothetical protein HRR85_003196 [Exophiala dermatitidis]